MAQCPACHTSFDAMPDVCPDCGVILRRRDIAPVLTTTADDLIVLAQFDSQLEAQILEGRLKSEGIDAMIGGSSMEAAFGMNDPGTASPYQILIHRPQATAALRLIGQDAEWTEEALNAYIARVEGTGA